MKTVSESEKKLKDIFDEISNIESTVSEEDAKVKIVNRLLIEVLDWSTNDLSLETKHDNGFSDYILSDRNKKCALIEAKRIGKIQIETANKDRIKYLQLSGSSLKKMTME